MKSYLCLALLLLASTERAVAETVYVTDILRLGIHSVQDTSDAPFQNLVSGTELEVLQRVPNYAEVRTPEGRQGWVKSAFLVVEKPAQLVVAETVRELDLLKQELAEADVRRISAETEAERVVSETAKLMGTADSVQATLDGLRADNEDYMARLELYRGSVPMSWAVAAFVVAFVVGMLVGVWSLDAYIRHRHGGFRLY